MVKHLISVAVGTLMDSNCVFVFNSRYERCMYDLFEKETLKQMNQERYLLTKTVGLV